MYCCICLVCMHRALSRCMLHFDLSICNAKVTNYHESANYMPALFINIYCCPAKRNHANRLKHQAPNATSNGGDASRVGVRKSYYLAAFVFSSFLYTDAGRVAPISACVFLQPPPQAPQTLLFPA